MSKSLPLADDLACSSPLTRAPMDADRAADVAVLLKALADPVRIRLMSLVLSHADQEACVCELTDAFDLSQPTISHHLKVLHTAGLLDRERRGVWVYYRARSDAMAAVGELFTDVGVPA
jgi:ArsR family transcriptional regulator